MVSGGTDNHLCLVDLRDKGIDGSRVQILLDHCHIYCNKNSVPGDKSALTPGGIRLGSPALTTRGLVESDFEKLTEFVDRGIHLSHSIKKQLGKGKKIKDF